MEQERRIMKKNKTSKRKGQIYLLIAGMIILAISTLANIAIHTSMPVEQKQIKTTSIGEMAMNLKIEMSMMKRNNISSSNITDFLNIFNNYSAEKNYESQTSEIDS